MIDLFELQVQVEGWSKRNFPGKKPHQPLLGLTEEVGELAHAHLKAEQGIRGSQEEHHEAKVDAVADIVIYLVDYCSQNNITLAGAVEHTWNKVKQRDWQKNPHNGNEIK